MVAATLVPSVRRVVPRPVETILWVALVVVCVIGVLSIANPRARRANSLGLLGRRPDPPDSHRLDGGRGHRVARRKPIHPRQRAAGRGWRRHHGAGDAAFLPEGAGWQPRVRLYEWMELPRLPIPAAEPVAASYAVDELSRKWAAAMAVAGAALLAWLVHFLIWARDVRLPQQAARLARAAAVGRSSHAPGWRRCGIPSRAFSSQRTPGMSRPERRRSTVWRRRRPTPCAAWLGEHREEGRPSVDRAADIHVLVSALSIGWYGPMRPASNVKAEEEGDEGASQQTGRLAS